jgi:serine phosphatase RsbU (regulator of sigma subunit)
MRNDNKTIEFFLRSLKIDKELADKDGMSTCYNNIGLVYEGQGNYDQAIKYYLNSLKISEELNDKNGIVLVSGNIANLHINIADSSLVHGKRDRNWEEHIKKAIEYGENAYMIAKEINSSSAIYRAVETLYRIYKVTGNYKKSLEFAELFIITKDSIFSEEKTNALAEMGAKYETEKKQLKIAKLQKQKELDDITIETSLDKNQKLQIIIISFIFFFLIVVVFSITLFKMFRQKRKANLILAAKNFEIQQKNEEISFQHDFVNKQKEHIEIIHKKVTDSINYAKRIQEAVFPTRDAANNIFGEHFILFKPKDIVSGDFYWGTRINQWLIVTVADCTGHGVPGAFMSMLGISFLNEIVRKKEITKASTVLDNLRLSIIEALQQKGYYGEQQDGMDIVFCAINLNTLEMQIAGANNPLIIVKYNKEILEIEPDKQPISIYENMKPFTNHQIQFNKGDCIYLTSDGYQDQFGGKENKKFKAKQLKDLFVNISEKTMNEQNEILDKTFEHWKDKHEQVDDVTILGLKL